MTGPDAGGGRFQGIAERVRGLADGTLVPVAPRDAATVVLLRDRPTGPEAYLLRRVRAMSFAAGMHVFPGGSVDPADAEAHIGWVGPPVATWAGWLSCGEPLARALVCAAVRETFEESGVLLAGRGPDDVIADVSTDDWEAERVALEAREHSLSELLARRGLVLRADLLRPLAHWITPEAEPKRFDTRFFLAELPAGQVCRTVGTEADSRLWVRPADALAQGLTMMPPTESALREVADASDVAAALAAPREVVPVMPTFVLDEDGLVLRVPGAPP
ncbi:MAG TPA: NUDIX hydrolase [Mycobacteriales bacterium]|jgi:8-oxo-dGTP pyrophosphatase MutT (NUDIX family)|nr:NUDIX hydrolase [Mycobacteriales bacterium]